jgi:hypothetical protein
MLTAKWRVDVSVIRLCDEVLVFSVSALWNLSNSWLRTLTSKDPAKTLTYCVFLHTVENDEDLRTL